MTLVVMSGLPGSGKSRLAAAVARELGCAVVSVDTVERGLHDAGIDPAQPLGLAAYEVRVVQVECSDEALHRERLAARDQEIREVPWERVVGLRESWTPWPVPVLVVDTADRQEPDATARGVVSALSA
ncbi:AAA family ATPase [Nocardioides terrigena]|uniref:AAA family ATPase n=1 Tax=Nocardioides terrigena TaxID=424797 RepID=UPI000D31FEA4|nr:AAA family ATPase [Nocardioides terrigena]